MFFPSRVVIFLKVIFSLVFSISAFKTHILGIVYHKVLNVIPAVFASLAYKIKETVSILTEFISENYLSMLEKKKSHLETDLQ